MAENRASAGHPETLARSLTLIPAAALIVTNVIGTGVFFKARVMTCNVGEPWLVLLAYATPGLLTLAGALSFAELSAMMPRAGGQYDFIGAAFGRVYAFLYGWMETLLDGAASRLRGRPGCGAAGRCRCCCTFVATPGRALAGLGIVALGLPVCAYYSRHLPPSRPQDWLIGRECSERPGV